MGDLISQKPTELQREAFEKAVQQTVDVTLNNWKQNAIMAVDKQDYISGRIEFLKERLTPDQNDKDKERKLENIQLRKYSYLGFDEALCKEIIAQEKPKIWYVFFNETENGEVVAKKENESFVLAVDYHLKRKLEKLDVSKLEKTTIAPNYKGELSDECIEDLKKFRKDNPDMPVNDFFERAFNLYTSCRYLIKDGKKEKMSWSTLRNRTKKHYPEIHNRKK